MPIRRSVPPCGTSVTVSGAPQCSAASPAHAGLAGGLAAEPFTTSQLSSGSARALPLDNWEVVKGSAASPPASPACAGEAAEHCGAPETVTLVPHGGTDLRMGMLPLAFHE